MKGQHHYKLKVEWTGNNGTGTTDSRHYERSHTISIDGKTDILCSSDPAFRGDNTKHNPEEFLVAAVSSCHMLWYLHLCADAGVVITEYVDNPEGDMVEESAEGLGRFTQITLNPTITITDAAMQATAELQHEKAHKKCFIANSCNFPIHHKATYILKKAAQ